MHGNIGENTQHQSSSCSFLCKSKLYPHLRRIKILTSSRSMYPVCLKSYNLNATAWTKRKKLNRCISTFNCLGLKDFFSSLRSRKNKKQRNFSQSIFFAIEAAGWKTPRTCTNSSNSITPFCFSSKRSKT